jgi:hypothetical protein
VLAEVLVDEEHYPEALAYYEAALKLTRESIETLSRRIGKEPADQGGGTSAKDIEKIMRRARLRSMLERKRILARILEDEIIEVSEWAPPGP